MPHALCPLPSASCAMLHAPCPLPGGAIIIEGHVQGLSNTRSLGQAGVPVIVVDTGNCVAKHSRYCQVFYKCPPYDSDDLADFLIGLAQDKGLQDWLLLPSNDHAVLTISRNKKKLEERFKVITPGLEIIENIYDKGKLLDVAQKAGVPIPGTYYAQSSNPQDFSLSFPVLTRGRFGLDFYKATGKKAFLAQGIHELREQLAFVDQNFSVRKSLTQEVIPDDGTNKTVSFCAFCERGEIKTFWMGAKLREHPIRFGTATFAKSIYVQECYEQSMPLLQALNYTGVCEVEYLRDPRDGQYKLIEINPRTWLWVGLARACGVDFARIMYDYVNGKEIDYPQEYELGKCWMNPFTDTVYSLLGLFQRKIKLKEYLLSIYQNNKVDALFKKKDIRPGFVYFSSMFNFLKHR
ncbi:MAG: hypothetical protein ACQEUB_14000 [Thermodesulfobacteriota bacterium]